jgi:hypothetical protein
LRSDSRSHADTDADAHRHGNAGDGDPVADADGDRNTADRDTDGDRYAADRDANGDRYGDTGTTDANVDTLRRLCGGTVLRHLCRRRMRSGLSARAGD